MKFKAYHKIRQFSDVIRAINYVANFSGLDDSGNPIYTEKEKPTLTFKGTVKLHGTNAGICYDGKTLLAQKRKSLLPADGHGAHFGFNFWVQVKNKDIIHTLMDNLWKKHCVEGEQIILYGEWAGTSIQKGVSISELPKAFYYFDLKVYNPVTDESKWIDISTLRIEIDGFYNIHNFSTYSLTIDFNNPKLVQNDIIELTNNIEKECPVAAQLGVKGVGEGVVFTSYWKGQKYIFKSKGLKHSSSKVKTLAAVDPELLKSVTEFVDYAATDNRIEQGIQEVNATEKKDIPALLKWVANDIIEEEKETLIGNDLEWKQVARDVNIKVRTYYLNKLNYDSVT